VNKYRAIATVVGGHRFDSKKEAGRYQELKVLEKRGIIKNLELQRSFELIPTQKDSNGKTVEQKCTYKADFCYTQDGEFIVEDVKSPATRTSTYVLKRKLMLWVHGIRIREI